MGSAISSKEIKGPSSDQENNTSVSENSKCAELSSSSQKIVTEFLSRKQNRTSTWVKANERKQLHKLSKEVYYGGDLVNGKKEGFGKLYWNNKSFYEGQFQNDFMHGTGKFVARDMSSYYGNWVHGHISGKGVLRFADGRIYTGQFLNGVAEGEGQIKYPNGIIIKGIWRNGELTECS